MVRPEAPGNEADAGVGRFLAYQGATLAAGLALVMLLDLLGLPRMITLIAMPLIVLAVFLWSGFVSRPDDASALSPLRNGLGIAASALSPALLIGAFAAVFANGQDGHVYLLGLAAGLALVPLWLAAPFRRSGRSTIPAFLHLRYASPALSRAAAAVTILVAVLVAAADLGALGLLSSRLAGIPAPAVIVVGAAVGLLCVSRGGFTSMARVQPLLLLVLAAALLLPLLLVTAKQSGLPSAQLGLGSRVAEMPALEQGLIRRGLADARTMRPLLTPFLALDAVNWVGIAFAVMLGTAATPHVLARAAATAGAPSARRSFGWALAALAVVATAVPALAVMAKSELLGLVGKGLRLDAMPQWIWTLGQAGGLKICGIAATDPETVVAGCRKIARHPGLLRLQDMAIEPDLVLPLVPQIAGTAFTATALMASGLLAALLAAVQAPLLAAATAFGSLTTIDDTESGRARWMLPIIAAIAALLAISAPAEPLTLLVWGLSIAASALLPPLLLGIWWRRITATGALAGMLTGLLVCTGYIIGTRFFAIGLHDLLVTWSDASPAALRRIEDLRRILASATSPAAKDAAWIALDTHAQRIVGIFGLRGTSAVLLAVPAALLVTIAVSLVTSTPGSAIRSRIEILRRPLDAQISPPRD